MVQEEGEEGVSGLFGTEIKRSHHKSVEWYTPKWIFDDMGITFDMDPCSPLNHETFVPAEKKLTIHDNGLTSKWIGKVFLNPPYGTQTARWMGRYLEHGNGIALVFSRTDSVWFQKCFQRSDAILFFAGRIDFIPGHENKHKKSHSGAASAMFALGEECIEAVKRLRDKGTLIIDGKRVSSL